MTAAASTMRLCHLYPRHLGTYGDRGNIVVLQRRAEWRGLALEVHEVSVGERLDPAGYDLYYMGGGQDLEQRAVADDLAGAKAAHLRSAAGDGAAMLVVCAGYQLAGHGYRTATGVDLPGAGVLDLTTRAGPGRLSGDVLARCTLGQQTFDLVGYENHGGRTHLGPGCRPLGRTIVGAGNNGRDHQEGAVAGRVVGTYLHGPLLPRNPRLADQVLAWALAHRRGTESALAPLDDELEHAAHLQARQRVGVPRSSTFAPRRPARLLGRARRRWRAGARERHPSVAPWRHPPTT